MNGLTFVIPLLIIAALIAYAACHRPREERMSEAWCERHRTGDV